jgi:hypothetical protein
MTSQEINAAEYVGAEKNVKQLLLEGLGYYSMKD